jgi:hypothetical protein
MADSAFTEIGAAASWRAYIAVIRIHGVAPGLAGAVIAKDFPPAKEK